MRPSPSIVKFASLPLARTNGTEAALAVLGGAPAPCAFTPSAELVCGADLAADLCTLCAAVAFASIAARIFDK